MKYSEKFLNRMNSRQQVRCTPEYQLKDIERYGEYCNLEAILFAIEEFGTTYHKKNSPKTINMQLDIMAKEDNL